jgi:CubicO group peptidase (beta-lactamase class C family)
MPTIVQSIAYILPVISYIVYKAATKPPFISLFSAITGLGYPSNIPIHGFADEEYKEAYDHFVNNFKMGYDVGAAVSVYVDGKQVISLQGGWQDREKKIEYTKDTLQMVFSVTKTLVIRLLVQEQA